MRKNYIVHYKRGRIAVTVEDSVIQLRGERSAVAQEAWFKLMGQNSLGEDVDKTLRTRKILRDEMSSRYESERESVYLRFMTTVEFTLLSLEH